MKRLIRYCLIFISLSAFAAEAWAGEDEDIRFAYDVDFETKFDNREFSRSEFSSSMTIFGARLTPSVGISIAQPEKSMNHRLMAGIDVMKDFGASPISSSLAGDASDEASSRLSNLNLFREITLYYQLEKKMDDTKLELYAGIFPRRAMEGSYSDVFFSDSLRFYDNNLEGILFKLHRPKGYWEVGCDWFGMKGQVRKEKFMIYTSGQRSVTPFMNIGLSGYMYHFAGSRKARGVVDNILINPYMSFEFGRMLEFQKFNVRLGWVQAMQHDRVNVGHYVFPGGGELDLDISNWNVGIRNRLFFGNDMMPYYNSADTGGDKYGNRLYFGDPFYRIHDDGSQTAGLYDRFEVYYEPHVGKYLSIRIAARFHFNGNAYSGCQQIVGVRFNLAGIRRAGLSAR